MSSGIIRLLGSFALFAIIGVGAFIFRDRLSSDASDTQIGDCVRIPAAAEFTSLQHTPCNEPHDGEVYFETNYPDQETIPTQAQFEAFFQRECLGERFQAYTGQTYEQAAAIDAVYFFPTDESWPQGDREIVCLLTPSGGGTISQSYRTG